MRWLGLGVLASLLGAGPAMAAKTYEVGAGGGWPDLNAAVAAALADPAVVRDGAQLQDIVFAVTRGGVAAGDTQRIAGWKAGKFSVTIRPADGQGFREYLRAHPDDKLHFDPEYGAFLRVNGGEACLRVEVGNATIFGMQIECTGGGGQLGVVFGGTPATVDSSIVVWAGATHNAPGIAIAAPNGLLRVRNTLVLGTDPNDSMAIAVEGGSKIEAYDDLLAAVGPVAVNQGAGIYDGPQVVHNVAAFNFGTCGGGHGGENNAFDFLPSEHQPADASNDLTCFKSFSRPLPFAHRGQAGADFTTEIVGRDDWRIAPGAVRMRGTGERAPGGITVDMLGRPRNVPDDIGPWAFPGGTPVPELKAAQQFVIPAGTTAWTVPAACNGPANAMEAFGAGGPGGNAVADVGPGRGGGGGEYAERFGYPFTSASPGTRIPVVVPGRSKPGAQPADTAFGAPEFVRAAAGQAGGTGHDAPGGMGGRYGLGMILHDGGDAGGVHASIGGSGGGGAAGRRGDGGNSGDAAIDTSQAGAGTGGGGGDGGAGSLASINQTHSGTDGGAGTGGTPGMPGGKQGPTPGSQGGANGGGGGGGSGFWFGVGDGGAGGAGGAGTPIGAGGAGTPIGASPGPGGGGGGGAGASGDSNLGAVGGDGGGIGGGGGGAGGARRSQSPLRGGTGAPGLIVVRCVKAPT